MKNKVQVIVAGQTFTILSEEDEGYVLRIAEQVDTSISGIMSGSHLSLSHAAVLTALNLADKYQKNTDISDHLRHQLREHMEETQRLKAELSEARREISRLRNGGK